MPFLMRNDGKNRRILILALVCAWVGTLFGCNVASSFTGGGVPIGKAALVGKVVSAINGNVTVPNATIQVTTLTRSRATYSFRVQCDANGRFELNNIPVQTMPSQLLVQITPANPQYQTQQIRFDLGANQTANLIVALPPITYNIAQGVAIEVFPKTSTVSPQDFGAVTAHVLDAQGHALEVMPTLLFIGNFSEVRPDGTYAPSASGSASVQAFWYGDVHDTAYVTVTESGTYTPPPPPLEPNPVGSK